MKSEVLEKVKEIIKDNRYLTLATANSKGEIWTTPLSYVADDQYNFYFVTALDSRHIENIKENPYVSFSIFDSTLKVSDIDGIQASGIVGELEFEKLPLIVKNYYEHVFPDPKERSEWEADYTNFTKDDYPVYRFFQIMPTVLYKRDTKNIDVDRRIEINLKDLRGE